MCGITGYRINKKIDKDILKNMNLTMTNRGPDSSGYFYDNEFSGAMRRLSINDIKNGDQPLFNQKKNIVLFYNGEIYNYNYLKEHLKNKGYEFRTRSDGEVICHLYDEYKTELFSMLDGMFAIALWLRNEKKLILARDIAGEKPLYYYKTEDRGLVYGSTLKSICKFPGVDDSLNFQGIWDLPTFLWVPQPKTIFSKIESLPRGHYLSIDNNKTEIVKYNYKYCKDYSNLNDKELIQITRDEIEKSVNLRLLSDVPIGSFLSGGLDSSIVSYLASKKIDRLNTYTIGFDSSLDLQHGQTDESSHAIEFSKYIGSNHQTIRIKSSDFKKILRDFVSFSDQPLAVSSGLGIMSIAKKAKEDGIKVLLSGDCADECFGGYSWYPYINEEKNRNYLQKISNVIFHNYRLDVNQRAKIINTYPSDKQAWAWHYFASEEQKKDIFSSDVVQSSQNSLRHFKQYNSNPSWDPITYVSQDRDFYLTNEMLQKLDRMTMASSVEGRIPFAAPSILNLSEQLKFSHFYQNNTLKWILKEAFKDLLPYNVINRPKHGFNVPLDDWFRNDWSELVDETFSSSSNLMKENIIHSKSKNFVKKLVADDKTLNSPIIFSFIVLDLWLKERETWK